MLTRDALGDDSTRPLLDRPERRGLESTPRGRRRGDPEGHRTLRAPTAIGHGTYGDVFEAFDPEREIRAAVKLFGKAPEARRPSPGFGGTPQAAGRPRAPEHRHRHRRRASTRAPWVATELVTGVSLAQVVRSRAFWPVERVLDVWRQLCEGLAHAHREGLLHLDLKPTRHPGQRRRRRQDRRLRGLARAHPRAAAPPRPTRASTTAPRRWWPGSARIGEQTSSRSAAIDLRADHPPQGVPRGGHHRRHPQRVPLRAGPRLSPGLGLLPRIRAGPRGEPGPGPRRASRLVRGRARRPRPARP